MTKEVTRFYDGFARFYPVLDLFLQKHKRTLAKRVNRENPGRLLEVGVGRGDILKHYTHRQLTGIDMSEGMLAFARKDAPAGCALHRMDASSLEFPDASFEYVVLSYVLSVVPDASRVMGEVGRVLVPGGKAFILNHESSRGLGKAWNKVLDPVVSKVLRFSTTFELAPAIDPALFTVLEHTRSGLVPRISRLIVQKTGV